MRMKDSKEEHHKKDDKKGRMKEKGRWHVGREGKMCWE